MNETANKANRQIARAAGTVMLAFIISQLAGLARSILVARTFGAGAELSAFFAANRVSETLFTLLAGGVLSSAFIPTFTTFLTRKDKKSAWRMASAVANLITLILGLLAALAAIFAPQISRYLLVPGFANDPALLKLTVDLLRIQLGSAVIFALGGLVMGVLNAHQIFLIPALTPAMYQLGLIFGVLVLAPSMGIYGLAYGVLIGSALYLLLQVPTLIKHGARYSLTLGRNIPAVGEVLRLMGPRIFGAAIVQLNFWVNIWLGSEMPDKGSVAGLSLGFALMLMAEGAIAQSIAIAAMPTLSAQYALGKLDDLRSSLAASLRGVILLALPAALGLILLRVPIITLLYQRGEFDAHSTQLVAWALLWYASGLIFHSILEVLARSYYAMHDTKTPVLVGATAMGINVGLSFALVAVFNRIGWMPHGGLALANTLATAIETTTLTLLIRRRMKGIHGRELLKGFSMAGIGTLSMCVMIILWLQAMQNKPAAITSLGGVALGAATYGLILILLRVPELRSLFLGIKRRLGIADPQS
jgi:putative peptidoglycan lipid II flippase